MASGSAIRLSWKSCLVSFCRFNQVPTCLQFIFITLHQLHPVQSTVNLWVECLVKQWLLSGSVCLEGWRVVTRGSVTRGRWSINISLIANCCYYQKSRTHYGMMSNSQNRKKYSLWYWMVQWHRKTVEGWTADEWVYKARAGKSVPITLLSS